MIEFKTGDIELVYCEAKERHKAKGRRFTDVLGARSKAMKASLIETGERIYDGQYMDATQLRLEVALPERNTTVVGLTYSETKSSFWYAKYYLKKKYGVSANHSLSNLRHISELQPFNDIWDFSRALSDERGAVGFFRDFDLDWESLTDQEIAHVREVFLRLFVEQSASFRSTYQAWRDEPLPPGYDDKYGRLTYAFCPKQLSEDFWMEVQIEGDPWPEAWRRPVPQFGDSTSGGSTS